MNRIHGIYLLIPLSLASQTIVYCTSSICGRNIADKHLSVTCAIGPCAIHTNSAPYGVEFYRTLPIMIKLSCG